MPHTHHLSAAPTTAGAVEVPTPATAPPLPNSKAAMVQSQTPVTAAAAASKATVTTPMHAALDLAATPSVLDSSASATTAGTAHSESTAASLPPTTAATTPPKRSPPPFLKYGYLFKQSSGKWKRKRWNQRWFVLDSETGVLKYFRHASLPESVHFRQDAHGALQLHEKGVALVIQGDLPRGVPTPFCFTISGSDGREIRICADTNQEFKEWTNAISLVMSPRDATDESDDAYADRHAPAHSPPRLAVPRDSDASSVSESSSGPPSPSHGDDDSGSDTDVRVRMRCGSTKQHASSASRAVKARSTRSIFPPNMRNKLSRHETTAVLLMLNPVVVLIRFGSLQAVYATAFFINAVLVWLLWLHNAPDEVVPMPTTVSKPHRTSTRFEPTLDFDALGDDAPLTLKPPQASKLSGSGSSQFVSSFAGTIDGVRVMAGTSVKQCAPAPAELISGCWTQICATRFNVRQGPNYRRTKIKAASAPALLELVAIDVYRSEGKIDNIASVIDISNLRDADGVLDLFVVNCQVPNYQPSNPLWGEKQGDGTGFNFVTYFAIPRTVRAMLDSADEPPLQAVRLLKDFMLGVSGMHDRFKAIGIVVNPQEQKLGRTERHLLETYNGQPILTRPQHRFYRGDGYFEVDVDAHAFNFVARKGLVGVSEHFRNMVVDFGFVLEGQDDGELPEQVLGSVRLCKIDVRQALVLV